MNSKERVIKAIKREGPDRVPLDGQFRPEAREKLYKHFGLRDDHDIQDKFGLDLIWVGMGPGDSFKKKAKRFSPYQSPFGAWGMGPGWLIPHPGNVVEDEWGIKRQVGKTGKYWRLQKGSELRES